MKVEFKETAASQVILNLIPETETDKHVLKSLVQAVSLERKHTIYCGGFEYMNPAVKFTLQAQSQRD